MHVIVLAAGKSKRFNSARHKSLHPLLGRPVIQRVFTVARSLCPTSLTVVVGDQHREILELQEPQEAWCIQEKPLGTADALLAGLRHIAHLDSAEGVLVMCADTPLLRRDTLKALCTQTQGAQLGLLTTKLEDPHGYGRIIRDSAGRAIAILEHKYCNENCPAEVNSGVYSLRLPIQESIELLVSLSRHNSDDDELLLTDIVASLAERGATIVTHECTDPTEVLGINTKRQLAQATKILSLRRIGELSDKGVLFLQPESCLLAPEVSAEADVTIWGNTTMLGDCSIQEGTTIGPNVWLEDCNIGRNCTIRQSWLMGASIGDDCKIGPFAHIRPGTVLARDVIVGDFVEVKNSVIGSGSRLPHLSYVGDADLAEDVNMAAGSITANYNSLTGQKNRIKIASGVKISCNSVLVAPVSVASGCLIGAGSVIARDITAPDSLALTRAPLVVKPGWVAAKRTSLTANS